LIRLRKRILKRFPRLPVVGAIAPPFRPLSDEDNARIVQHIQRSGAQLVFVALGCPRQERWIAEQKGRVQAVMIGVGAAFDFHAGTRHRAPRWMRAIGFEWLHRLFSEPRRLAWRYLSTNTVFVVGALGQLLARPFARWR
jgi:N-acetylglucosaminyldiphosphoundecaprenol N-acetyl-beta-D-mannosaminyltransferase